MDIVPVSRDAAQASAASRAGAGAPTVTADEDAAAKASSGATEDRFLKLLVAQMRNQDPLNPLDNAQVTSQLAQINTVNGIEKLNASMQKLLERFAGNQSLDAATLLGHRALTEGDVLELGEAGAVGGFELTGPAQSVRIEILDSGGAVVDTRELGRHAAGVHRFDWNGRSVAGQPLAQGSYQFRVVATNGKDAVDATPLMSAQVQGVTRGSDGPSVQLGSLGARALEALRGIF
ncbi:MAG TPA: flagellar hook assembly protein FlgD [Burkholderiaceae bacterium]|nr:flagellar hook assembly protein FlgD [Burkholderiaceae bacterium]